MKPKIILGLAAVVLLNSACRVLGSMVILSVDSTNIQTMPFVVKSERADYGKSIQFKIIADPKGPPYAPDDSMHFILGGASLSVYESANFITSHLISSCSVSGEKVPSYMQDVKPPLAAKGVLFEFKVGTNHLDSVEFEIGYGSTVHPAVDQYRFALQTFVPPMDAGFSLGLKDNRIEIVRVQPDTLAAKAGLSPGMVVQRISGADIASMTLAVAEDAVANGSIVHLELFDPANCKTNDVLLTCGRTFP